MKIKVLLFLIFYLFGQHFCCAMDKQATPKFELHYAYSARQGLRPTMEDAYVVLPKFNGDMAFFGVYDGHGGAQVAHFAAQNLHVYVHENLISDPQKSRDEILKTAFAKTEQNIFKKKLDSGSTAVVSLLEDTTLYCAWLGDSRAILIRKGQIVAATQDHKPNVPEERKRIEEAGGKVFKMGVWRSSMKYGLAVSRALGDQSAKEEKGGSGLIAVPDIIHVAVQDDDILLLACDGLWDIINNEKVAEKVTELLAKNTSDLQKEYHESPLKMGRSNQHEVIQQGGDAHLQVIANLLRDAGYPSRDNISVVLVRIKERLAA